MLTRRLILAAAALGGLILTGVSVAADDGETKTLLKNSYQQSAEISCAGAAANCVLQFPPVTAAKTVVTAVSCSVFVTSGSLVGFVLTDFGTINSILLPAFVFSQGGVNAPLQAATNSAVKLFFEKGGQPAVLAVVSNGGQFSTTSGLGCTISGYHSE
jgi:hypothetical protein